MLCAAFEALVLAAILTNCVFMAMNPWPLGELETASEQYFVGFFTFEAMLKIIGLGFICGRNAYLRSGWNCLDFVVVVTGVTSVIAQGVLPPDDIQQLEVFQALRAVRVLRPLRTIARVPGMRVIVHSLLDAVPQLAGVMVLFVTVLLISGVVGIQLFVGLLHTRCYAEQVAVRPLGSQLCPAGGALSPGAPAGCVDEVLTPAIGATVPDPLLGYPTSVPLDTLRVHELSVLWDATASSALPPLSLRVGLSMDNATWTYYELTPRSARSPPPPPLSGSPMPPSLPPLLPPLPPTSPEPPSLPLPCPTSLRASPGQRYAAVLPAGGVVTRAVRIAISSACPDGANGTWIGLSAIELHSSERAPVDDTGMCCDPASGLVDCGAARLCPAGERCLWDARNPNGMNSFDNIITALITIFQAMTLEGWTDTMYMLQDAWHPAVFLYFVLLVSVGSFYLINLFLAVIFESFSAAAATQRHEAQRQKRERQNANKIAARYSLASLRKKLSYTPAGICAWLCSGDAAQRVLYCQSRVCVKIIGSRWFDRISLLLIVINTVILCCYYHDMDYQLEQLLEYSNLILTELFTLELVCNIAGQGIAPFFFQTFNCFDALIVCTSQAESVLFLLSKSCGTASASGRDALNACRAEGDFANFSILRAFRLLRFLKLAQSLPGLRQIIITLGKSVYSMANLLFILLLLMFIFALLGMELWGGRFTPDRHFPPAICLADVDNSSACDGPGGGLTVPPVRWHFEYFHIAFVTTYVVISGENWNEVYFDCYQALGGEGSSASWLAHVYFVMLYLAGNTVVLSLFIAIMLQNSKYTTGLNELRGEDPSKKRGTLRRLLLKHRKRAPRWLAPLLLAPKPTSAAAPAGSARDEEGEEEGEEAAEEAAEQEAQAGARGARSPSPALSPLPAAPPCGKPARAALQLPTSATRASCLSALRGAKGLLSPPRTPLTPKSAATRAVLDKIRERRTRTALEEGHEAKGWGVLRQATGPSPAARGSADGILSRRAPAGKTMRMLCRAFTGTSRQSTACDWDPMDEFDWTRKSACVSADAATSFATRESSCRPAQRVSQRGGRENIALERPRDALEYVPLLDRDLSLCYFRRAHPLRATALRLIASKQFEWGVLVLIVASSITLAAPHIEYPSYEDRCLADSTDAVACNAFNTLNAIDDVFTGLFTLEAAVKILALGLIIPASTAYLRDPWNVLDFTIVVVSLVTLVYKHAIGTESTAAAVITATSGAATASSSSSPFASLKTLRAMRCLRPLRFISRNPGMKMVVNSLLRALPGVANVFLVMTSLLLIFGILGVQLFMGKFAQCTVPGVYTSDECEGAHYGNATGFIWQAQCVVPWITTRVECDGAAAGYEWASPSFGNFDDVFAAILCLFEMSGLERWPEVMYHGMDVVGIDRAPQRDAAPAFALYFMLWIFIGAFCVNNLVVGVVVANFTQIKEQEDSYSLMTDGQREWVDTLNRSTRLAPRKTYRPASPRRRALWYFVRHNNFELSVQLLIVVNVALMLVSGCNPVEPADGVGQGECVEPEWNRVLQQSSNFVFTSLYLIEAVLKIIAYGRAYFYYAWNVFDFTLVASSLVDVGVELVTMISPNAERGDTFINPATLRIVRIVRITRLLRLVRHAARLRTLITAFVMALPALVNVGSLLLLLLFVFASLGVSLFHAVPFAEFVNEHAHFQTLPVAALTLFRAVTGETWNGLMHECLRVDSVASVPYFVAFYLVASFILLNLVIAVILENFGTAVDDASREVPQEVLLQYREEWERLDPEATGNISSDKLMLLLRRVRRPLGFKRDLNGSEVARPQQLHFMSELGVHDHGGMVNFQILLQALTQYVHAHGEYRADAAADGSDPPQDQIIQMKMLAKLRSAMRAANAYDLPPPDATLAELHAALLLQARWRKIKARQAANAGVRRASRRPSVAQAMVQGAQDFNDSFQNVRTSATERVTRAIFGNARSPESRRTPAILRSLTRRRPAPTPQELDMGERLKRLVADANASHLSHRTCPCDPRHTPAGTPRAVIGAGAAESMGGTARSARSNSRPPIRASPSPTTSPNLAGSVAAPPPAKEGVPGAARCGWAGGGAHVGALDLRSMGAVATESEVDISELLSGFDMRALHRCKKLRVPVGALYYLGGEPGCGDVSAERVTGGDGASGAVGFFVTKEVSARLVSGGSRSAASQGGPIGCFSNLFGGSQSSVNDEQTPQDLEGSAFKEAGPYRWVPALRTNADGDASLRSLGGSCLVSYDPESNGVGHLDASRVLANPEVALAHVRKQILSMRRRHNDAAGDDGLERSFAAATPSPKLQIV